MAGSFARASSQSLNSTTIPVSALPFTFSCWFYSVTAATTQTLMTMDRTGFADYMELLAHSGGHLMFDAAVASGPNRRAETANSWSANTWHHAAAVAASSTDRKSYLDADVANAGANSSSVTFGTYNDFNIGRYGGGSPGDYFDGRIAEVGVWNVALDTAEIAALAKGISPLLVRPSGLVFYAPLVRSFQDIRAALALTNTNTVTVGDHPRVFMPGGGRTRRFTTAAAAGGLPFFMQYGSMNPPLGIAGGMR